ncbi:MAG: hypothetical protein E5Y19_21275 [Mesorhizobium sp.]|nr:MAG: hypothetical protein E5Y19_21275 [Mesorhizobium sp.]TJU88196.1 MAG: hypothetical protein E5Y15_05480 [Mesorhizobium sp.]
MIETDTTAQQNLGIALGPCSRTCGEGQQPRARRSTD